MKFPDIYRSKHPLNFEHSVGDPFGWFCFEYNNKIFYAQADAQTEWEHVSVSSKRIPTWEEMCYVKSLFWNDDPSEQSTEDACEHIKGITDEFLKGIK